MFRYFEILVFAQLVWQGISGFPKLRSSLVNIVRAEFATGTSNVVFEAVGVEDNRASN
jgi:hypothetical protein